MPLLDITNDARKFLSGLDAKKYRQVAARIFDLMRDVSLADSSALKGYENYRRIDVGEYRVVYRFTESVIYVVVVGKRNDDEVFRDFGRKV